MATKVSEKLFLMRWVRDDPPFFEILKDRLVGLMMTGEENVGKWYQVDE